MIRAHFTISNPWPCKTSETFFCKEWIVTAHKSFEIECYISPYNDLLEIMIDTHFSGSDHAGPEISLTFFGINLRCKLYDHRHWNYTTKTWETYD